MALKLLGTAARWGIKAVGAALTVGAGVVTMENTAHASETDPLHDLYEVLNLFIRKGYTNLPSDTHVGVGNERDDIEIEAWRLPEQEFNHVINTIKGARIYTAEEKEAIIKELREERNEKNSNK